MKTTICLIDLESNKKGFNSDFGYLMTIGMFSIPNSNLNTWVSTITERFLGLYKKNELYNPKNLPQSFFLETTFIIDGFPKMLNQRI